MARASELPTNSSRHNDVYCVHATRCGVSETMELCSKRFVKYTVYEHGQNIALPFLDRTLCIIYILRKWAKHIIVISVQNALYSLHVMSKDAS